MHEAEDVSLSRRLTVALLTPLVLLVLVAGVLGFQVSRMREQAAWVEHTDQVIAGAFGALREVIDQETAIRGYLITSNPEFLASYYRVNPPQTLNELAALVSDNPKQARRVGDIRANYERWLSNAEPLLTATDLEPAKTTESMLARRAKMLATRSALAELIDEERSVRKERAALAEEATRSTLATFFALFAVAAIGLGSISRHQLKGIASTYRTAFSREREALLGLQTSEWVREGQLELARALQGELSSTEIGLRALAVLAQRTNADVGAFYVADHEVYRRTATHALGSADTVPEIFSRGEGLVGQAAASEERIVKRDLPPEYLRIRSASGEHSPIQLVVFPARVDGGVQAVVELGFLRPIEARALDFLERTEEPIAVAVRSADYRARLRDLLRRTQQQAEQLSTQEEELRVQNEELEEQSQALQEAQRRLETQHTELEQTNQDLKHHSELLENRNTELLRARAELSQTASEVARANQYKSEFLANMSHELRTPLNSTLILAKLLADNPGGNLKPEQVRFAETIYSAGNELLSLINDILDLSKIEAGRMDVHAQPVTLASLMDPVLRTFEPVAKEKNLAFTVEIDPSVERIHTDAGKLHQILNNLLSNAFKFTEQGGVSLSITAEGEDRVRFAVRDSGIGIEQDRQSLVFEAFRQADGTVARRFGGTGLGLAICRDLARLLGGDISLNSKPGEGSTFFLTIPRRHEPLSEPRTPKAPDERGSFRVTLPPNAAPAPRPRTRPPEPVSDDREQIDPGKRLILVIEDDPKFAGILVDLAHELSFQCVAAFTGEEGLELCEKLSPSAVLLDMNLPDCPGLVVLDRLKRSPATRHIPVHVVSVLDHSQTAREMGAVGYMLKPAKREELADAFRRLEARFTQKLRRVLVVEDDPAQRESICLLLGGDSTETVAVGTVAAALAELRSNTFDCVVTDLSLPDASGYDLLETMANDETCSFPPIVVYTGRSLSSEEEHRLRRFSDSIIVKGARSPERLLDEVTLFLHQVESELPVERQRMLKNARDREAIFEGRKILLAEDDVRNIFALSSLLEPKGAKIEIARNGREAIERLESDSDIDLVLMDIMMPEMDGLTAMREIRKRPAFGKLPIIALTAKAMHDDQVKCLQAGANDYASKPLDVERLLSLVRVWMPR